jgi:ribosome-associated protein
MDTLEKAKNAVKILDAKKGSDIKLLEITDCTSIADYYVLCNATSTTHIKSLADELEFRLEQLGVKPLHIEGRTTKWLVLDYGDVIVHIFTTDSRTFYDIDDLWEQAENIDISELITEN